MRFLACAIIVGLVACDSSTGGGASSATQHPLIGSPAPDFGAESVNGAGKVSLASLKGKVVVVDFWATWCDPCKKSFPKLQELYVKYKASGVEIVGVSEDDDKSDSLKKFGETYGAKFPLVWDDGKGIAAKFNLSNMTMPTSFILDKNGIVRFAHAGYHDGDADTVEKEIKSLL